MYKPTGVMSQEQIHAYCVEIQDYLGREYTADVPSAIVDRAQQVEAYMALTGKMLADAEYHYNGIVGSAIMKALKDAMEAKLSTTTLNKYVESAAKDSKYLVTWCDRLNRTSTHTLDVCRSILSKQKAELAALQYSGR